METNNANVNKELINSLLGGNGDEAPEMISSEEEANPMESLVNINLSTCRFAFSIDVIDWDELNIDEIVKLRDQFVAARFNLIMTEDVEKRAEIADAILKDITEIEKNLGLSIDYYNVRTNITKIESAYLAINDAITLYDWHINQYDRILTQKNIMSFLEDNNVNFVNEQNVTDTVEEVVPYPETKKDPDYILDPSLVAQLAKSYEDDHSVSGLITE